MTTHPRMTKMRSQLVINHPFFGFLISRLQLIEVPGFGTMSVDGRRWVYDPAFVTKCDDNKLLFVGAHGGLHCALNHPSRRNGRDPELWNIACLSKGTMVLMANNTEQAIETLVPGDVVWSPNGPSRILNVLNKGMRPTIQIKHDSRDVFATSDHRFLSEGGFINAELYNQRVHGKILRTTGKLGVCFGASQKNVNRRVNKKDRSEIHGDSTSALSPWITGGSLPNAIAFSDVVKNGIGILSRNFGWRRNAYNRAHSHEVFSTGNDHFKYFELATCMVGTTKIFRGRGNEFEWSSLLENVLGWIRPRQASETTPTIFNNQSAACRSAFGVHINTARFVEESAVHGSYARNCLNNKMAERTEVIVGRTRETRETFDLVTEHHVFAANGLLTHNCDHVVNLSLGKAGFVVPQDALCDQRFDGLSVDDVYRIIEAEQKQEQDDDNKDTGDAADQDQGGDSNNETADDDADQTQTMADANGPGDDQRVGSGNDGQSSSPDQSNSEGSEGSGSSPAEAADDNNTPSNGTGSDPGRSGNGNDDAPNEVEKGSPRQQPVIVPDCIDPGGCGGVMDSAPEHDQKALDEMADEWNVAVRQAANLARRQGEGRLPGFIEEIVKDLNTPATDWRDVLRDWIDPSSSKDYTWARPNRRMLPFDIISPGTTSDGINHVGIAIDTSGSIDSEMLKQFAGETQSALDDGKIDKVTVVFCDDRVQRTAEYTKGELIDFTAQGRGGTRFSPAFKWFMDNAPDISGMVYMTDLDCSDYGPEPHFKVLFAAYEQPQYVKVLRQRMAHVPFGECVELN